MNFNEFSKETKACIRAIIECIDDGIFITDGEGTVVELNQTALGAQQREHILGKNMRELIEEGIYRDSLSLQSIKEKQKVTRFQNEATEILTTAIPYIEDGKV